MDLRCPKEVIFSTSYLIEKTQIEDKPMLRTTNFNPIESINARLRPWGFTISTTQQMISKIAFASLAMLTIHDVLSTRNLQVEAGECRNRHWCEAAEPVCHQVCTKVCDETQVYWVCNRPC